MVWFTVGLNGSVSVLIGSPLGVWFNTGIFGSPLGVWFTVDIIIFGSPLGVWFTVGIIIFGSPLGVWFTICSLGVWFTIGWFTIGCGSVLVVWFPVDIPPPCNVVNLVWCIYW